MQYSYRCGGYASRVNACTAHSISADNVEALILSAVKRLSKFVLNDEEAFAKELQALWNEKQTEKPKHNKSELHRFQKRYDELSKLIRGLYENLVSGLLPERQYKQLMKQYDDEQAELETKIEEMEKELTEEKANTVDIKHFISLIRKCKEPTEISDLMFAELIDKIVVYEAAGMGKARTQKVDIYFNYVGQVDIAYTEEELAEIKAQEEQIEMERLAKQREREKAYREKRKAKKLAENGGEIVKTKICPHCQKSLCLQVTDRYSVQRIVAIRQGRIRQKPTEKQKKEIIIIVSVSVLCVAVPTGLHTVSRNSVPRNVKTKSQREIFGILSQEAKGEIRMQRFITDERTGIQYELIGDYYYPCLTIENEEPPALTKYGRMRERYLREHRKVLYCNLLTSGKLYEHLAEIDTSACNMAEYLIKEMARKQGVTEQLKAEDMMRWVGLMNNIRACADEIVLNDIVYS